MIRHVVLFKAGTGLPDREVAAVMEELAGLKTVVPGILSFAAGPDISPEGLAQGYSHAFTVDFADTAARDAYLIHPAHRRAGARLVDNLEGGIAGLLVLDFELP